MPTRYGGGNIKWLAEPKVVATQYDSVSFTASYGIFYVASSARFQINNISEYKELRNNGFVNQSSTTNYVGYVISHPHIDLLIITENAFLFAQNSIGQKFSSANKVGGSSNYITVYKLADIQ